MTLPTLLLQLTEGGAPVLIQGTPDLPPAEVGAFRRLLEQGVLEQQGQLNSWDPCVGCACGADERAVRWRDGLPVAVCPIDAGADTPLSPDELQVYRVSLPALAQQIGRALGVRDRVEEVIPSLWRLGLLAAGQIALLATQSTAVRRPGAMERVKAVDPAGRFILIGAIESASERAALAACGIRVVLPEEAFLPSEPAQPIRINPTRFGADAPGAEAPLLNLNLLGFTVTFHGKPVHLGPRDFRVLSILVREARDGAAAARRDDLHAALTEGAEVADQVGDEQIDKSINRIRGALCHAAGLPRAEGARLIATVRKHGYRLDVPGERIRID